MPASAISKRGMLPTRKCEGHCGSAFWSVFQCREKPFMFATDAAGWDDETLGGFGGRLRWKGTPRLLATLSLPVPDRCIPREPY